MWSIWNDIIRGFLCIILINMVKMFDFLLKITFFLFFCKRSVIILNERLVKKYETIKSSC